MRTKEWPSGLRIHVANLSVPRSFVAGTIAHDWQGYDQVSLDFIIDDGKIAAILPGGSAHQAPLFDAGGGQAEHLDEAVVAQH